MRKRQKTRKKRIKNQAISPPLQEHARSVFLNRNLSDRISFSILKNEKNQIRKIENISYEIFVKNKWEWVVRYDDHGGTGPLHRHYRISLTDDREIESTAGIRKYKNKDHQLTWVCNDIKRNYIVFRQKFLKNSGIDGLY